MANIQMNQSQSISMQQGGMNGGMGSGHQGGPMSGAGMHPASMSSLMQHQNPNDNQNTFPSLQNTSFSGQVADFNLDFLDNPAAHEATAQELLRSLDNTFLSDIL